jgi:predicted nucleotidyltransferase
MKDVSVRELIAEKRNEVIAAAARHGAARIRLIGSVARGAERADSDIDFLVSWEPWTSLLDCAALVADLETMDGCGRSCAKAFTATRKRCDRPAMRSDLDRFQDVPPQLEMEKGAFPLS